MKYRTRCLSRQAVLSALLDNPPSKELGPGNLDRCRGYSHHIQALLSDQWTGLSQLTDQLITLREDLADVHKLATLNIHLDQQEALQWMVIELYPLETI